MRCNGVICRLRGEVDGVKYDVGPIKASEGEKITAWTGYDVREWELHLTDADAMAAKGLLALYEFRAGRNVKFSALEIDDLDTVDFDLYDERGRKVSIEKADDGKPLIGKDGVTWLFDGEPLDPPAAEASPTD